MGLDGNIGLLAVEGERLLDLLLETEFRETDPVLSPDGRWLAYQSNESGDSEVYVRPFPDVDAGRWQVSNGGGLSPVWSPDGQELFFIGGRAGKPDTMMLARVETEPAFRSSTPERLFDVGSFWGLATLLGRGWDIAPDGNRFLFKTRATATQTGEGSGFNGLIFVENWFEELKARVPSEN